MMLNRGSTRGGISSAILHVVLVKRKGNDGAIFHCPRYAGVGKSLKKPTPKPPALGFEPATSRMQSGALSAWPQWSHSKKCETWQPPK
ncbi:hypothetical protein MTP99_004591 [Tenebrio molitor]|nr:hypothetical protein MTP99_004591 [Tenebrio molitor]